jgi:hypothetical protein
VKREESGERSVGRTVWRVLCQTSSVKRENISCLRKGIKRPPGEGVNLNFLSLAEPRHGRHARRPARRQARRREKIIYLD